MARRDEPGGSHDCIESRTFGSPRTIGAGRRDGADGPSEVKRMTDKLSPESGRLEQILKSVDYFKPISTRRGFMQKLMLAGGGAAVGAASLGRVANVFAASPSSVATGFVVDAIGAERIGIAFYGNALGAGPDLSVAAELGVP